jgi:hypothetical protein
LSRRVTLPAADDLFRPTAPLEAVPQPAEDAPSSQQKHQARPVRRPSGRVRHDEKMTVYVTSDELMDLEHARLMLRRDHALAVDRGRIVRAAIALALADLDAHGEDSALVRRLAES